MKGDLDIMKDISIDAKNPDSIIGSILIIDDDLTIKAMLEDTLRANGYHTFHASTSREGLRLVKEHLPVLIFLDIAMPEMDGRKVCQMIRNMNISVRPSIIMLINKDDKDIIADAIEKGADDFIIKPIDDMELISRLKVQSKIRQFYQDLHGDKRNLEAILDITNTLSTTLESSEVLYTIVKKVADITEAVRCSIVLIMKEDEGYVLVSHESPVIRDIKLDLNKYPEIREVLISKKPVVVEDIPNHPLMQKVKDLVKDLGQMSVLVLPIVCEEEVLGTLFLRAHRLGKGFTEKEIQLCQIIANSAYHAIKNARLFEEVSKEKEHMKNLAITDSLTQLYNHNFFYNWLDEEFNRAVRYDTPLSVIMVDLDDFKRINDTYGHRAGDKVLKEIADIIKKLVRKTDIVARYGGEEFAIILPHTNLHGAEEEAERIREAISNNVYTGIKKEKLSTSLGVASYPSGGTMNSGDLVNLADTALYEAKRGGKNRVVALGKK